MKVRTDLWCAAPPAADRTGCRHQRLLGPTWQHGGLRARSERLSAPATGRFALLKSEVKQESFDRFCGSMRGHILRQRADLSRDLSRGATSCGSTAVRKFWREIDVITLVLARNFKCSAQFCHNSGTIPPLFSAALLPRFCHFTLNSAGSATLFTFCRFSAILKRQKFRRRRGGKAAFCHFSTTFFLPPEFETGARPTSGGGRRMAPGGRSCHCKAAWDYAVATSCRTWWGFKGIIGLRRLGC